MVGHKLEKEVVNEKSFDKDMFNQIVNLTLDLAFYERVSNLESKSQS